MLRLSTWEGDEAEELMLNSMGAVLGCGGGIWGALKSGDSSMIFVG